MEEVIESGNRPNRIITYSVGGGFKKREPQAEAVKDIWKYLKELLGRGDK